MGRRGADRLVGRARSRPPLLVDFGNVQSLSSSMLGKLIELNRAAKSAGARMSLFNLRPDVREIMEVTKLNRILRLYRDESDAVETSETPDKTPQATMKPKESKHELTKFLKSPE